MITRTLTWEEELELIKEDERKEARKGARIEGLQEGREEGRQEGIQEGLEKGVIKVAKNMLKLGGNLDFISKTTGLSIDELKKMKMS